MPWMRNLLPGCSTPQMLPCCPHPSSPISGLRPSVRAPLWGCAWTGQDTCIAGLKRRGQRLDSVFVLTVQVFGRSGQRWTTLLDKVVCGQNSGQGWTRAVLSVCRWVFMGRYSRGQGRLPCLVCGALSAESRCRIHRTRQARGYDKAHYEARDVYIRSHPVCQGCMHTALHYGKCPVPGCPKCPLELDHTPSLDYIRKHPGEHIVIKYTVLCRQCNRRKSSQ
jgi:hypothetical protein